MPCDCRAQRRQAGRAVAADRDPRRRPDRAAPRALLRTGPLERDRAGRGHRRAVRRSTSPTASTRTTTRGPDVRRTPHRAGVIKVAGSDGGPSARDARVFEAAAEAHLRTGAPILTHCEARDRRARAGAAAGRTSAWTRAHVALSHVDKVVDRGYHRAILASRRVRRVRRVVPLGRRRRTARCSLLGWAIEDGLGRSASSSAWTRRGRATTRVYGGSPGPDLAARRVHGRDGERRDRRRLSGSGCSSTTRPGHSPSPRPMEDRMTSRSPRPPARSRRPTVRAAS